MSSWISPALTLSLLLLTSACAGKLEPSSPPADTPPKSCSAANVSGVEVTATDFYGGQPYALGYPPYSIDDCYLAYVAGPDAAADPGALLVRDLGSDQEIIVAAPASEQPRRPSLGGDILAWEATLDGRRSVRVRTPHSTVTVTGPFDHAGEPRAVGLGGVVFTGWLTADETGDTDVFLYTPEMDAAVPIAAGPGQQRFADISKTHIAFADFSEDPDGRFDENGTDLSDIAIYDRETEETTVRAAPGKQAFPLLGADAKIAYLRWGPDHPEPKFGEYDLFIGDIGAPVSADMALAHVVTLAPYVRPTARGRLIEWVDWAPAGPASLLRRPADASEPAKVVAGLDTAALYGPCASDTLTIVATPTENGRMILKGLDRPAP